MNADNIISKLITLDESKDSKKRKRKYVNHDHKSVSDSSSPKRSKSETKYMDVSLVQSPIKQKSENGQQNQESSSEDDNKFLAPINKLHPFKDKKEAERAFGLSRKAKKGTHNLGVARSSENETSSEKRKINSEENKRSNSEKKKFEKEKGSGTSFTKEVSTKGNVTSQFNLSTKERDSETHRKSNESPDDEVYSVLKNASSFLDIQKDVQNSDDSECSVDERTSSEKENWNQTFQQEHPGLIKQLVDFNLPGHARYSLIRVPKNIDPNNLRNLKCSFDKEVSNNKQYFFHHLTKKREPAFISLNSPRLVAVYKVIVLEKSVPLLPLSYAEIQKREKVSMPEAVKARHPLFGIDYKGKIRVEKIIKKKILEAIERKTRLERKEKKKKHRVKTLHNIANEEKSVLDLLNLKVQKQE